MQCITISSVLGAGIYIRSGVILRLGGPAAVLVSYAVVGVLAICVMLTIGEMVCIWPMSNALIEFVSAFLDEELGIVVGLAYWFGIRPEAQQTTPC